MPGPYPMGLLYPGGVPGMQPAPTAAAPAPAQDPAVTQANVSLPPAATQAPQSAAISPTAPANSYAYGDGYSPALLGANSMYGQGR